MDVFQELIKQGPLGLLNLMQAIAIVRLYNDLKAATTKTAETTERAIQVVQSVKEESKETQGLLRLLLESLRQLPPRRS